VTGAPVTAFVVLGPEADFGRLSTCGITRRDQRSPSELEGRSFALCGGVSALRAFARPNSVNEQLQFGIAPTYVPSWAKRASFAAVACEFAEPLGE
jgi:hypothetical protein